MSRYEEIAEAEEPVVVEQVTVVEEPSPAGEMLRFFVLIIVLGVTVLVVAAARPYIFGHIVPAVMGEGIVIPTPEPPLSDGEEEADIVEESPGEGEPATEENTADEAEPPAPAGEEMTSEGEAEAPEEATNESGTGETAENEPTSTTHTIQQGETLQSIAAQYGLTLQELIAANNLPNPDYIRVGDKLVIPQAEGGE
jgi:LysM repeat protein